MENITYAGYVALYGNDIDERDFSRLSFDAFRVMDDMTTGVDGYHKLRSAYPVEQYDAEAASRCAYALVRLMKQIEDIAASSGYTVREDGAMVGKRVSSVSSGAESISYASGSAETVAEAATASASARREAFWSLVREYLAGVKDANGVNMLYMGVYPRV